MIRIVNKIEAFSLKDEDIIGKYVLFDSGTVYYSLNNPCIVSSISGARVYLDEVERVWDDSLKLYLFSEAGWHNSDGCAIVCERKDAGYAMKKTIRCICDTTTEVNNIIMEGEKSHKEYNALLKTIEERFRSMSGKSITN